MLVLLTDTVEALLPPIPLLGTGDEDDDIIIVVTGVDVPLLLFDVELEGDFSMSIYRVIMKENVRTFSFDFA